MRMKKYQLAGHLVILLLKAVEQGSIEDEFQDLK